MQRLVDNMEVPNVKEYLLTLVRNPDFVNQAARHFNWNFVMITWAKTPDAEIVAAIRTEFLVPFLRKNSNANPWGPRFGSSMSLFMASRPPARSAMSVNLSCLRRNWHDFYAFAVGQIVFSIETAASLRDAGLETQLEADQLDWNIQMVQREWRMWDVDPVLRVS